MSENKKEIEVGDNLGCFLFVIAFCILLATCKYLKS